MSILNINGIEIFYLEQGYGTEKLLFIHGNSSSSSSWKEALRLLPANYHAYAVDLRGCGRSTADGGPYYVGQLADDVYHLALELNLGKFVCIGRSMGGFVSLRLALDHPEIIKGVVSIVSVPNEKPLHPRVDQNATVQSDKANHMQNSLDFPPTLKKQRLIHREMWLNQKNNQDISKKQKMDVEWEGVADVFAQLPQVTVPTVFLLGGKDRLNSVVQSVTSTMLIPGAKTVFFQGYGHGLSIDDPEKITDEIMVFINDINRNQ